MHDSGTVRVRERFRDVGTQTRRVARRQSLFACETGPQRFASHERHDVVELPIRFTRVEQRDNARMDQLRHERDFERFEGELVDLTLKAPLGAVAGGQVSANRKKFRGSLERAVPGAGWQITWRDEPPVKPGQKVSKKKEPVPLQVLGFQLDELKEARLAPVVDFKGRRPKSDAGES
jgi:ribosome maturation factor RimP